ncbi:ASKHA domain-containing protein [Candidatus Electronema sp. PJ]|uniref:ASKHA domain-containing protein n=1 Tax=Candidatus Electronema sp. PJ TaxID=3401572 RepID=UPI003AA80670
MKHTVTFMPDNITTLVQQGDTLLSAAAKAGIYVHACCGGDGVCGKCKVHVKGTVHSDKSKLTQEEWDRGWRLACRSTVESDIEVTVPELTSKGGKTLKRRPKTTRTVSAKALDALIGKWNVDPPVSKLYLELPPPTLEDNIADMQRVIRAIRLHFPQDQHREPYYDLPCLLKYLPRTLREADWKVTLLLLRGRNQGDTFRIIDIEAGDTTAKLYGVAIDIGTTTCSGVLINLYTGEVLAESSGYNGQISFGEDVISRIIYAARPGGLKALQGKVVATINAIIEDICRQLIISPSDIAYMMAAGNTVMSHLLLGLDPKYLREAPYVPSVSEFPLTRAAELGIHAHPSTRLFLYPCVASYVGGDIVSGAHACQIAKSEKVSLFIDIGTNGEIVVGGKDWLVCAACSAGPAFEGGGIQYGMRASQGAIEKFQIHPQTLEPMLVTIGQSKPSGICGSGLIAIVAELLENHVIDQQGKFHHDLDTPRIREGSNGWEYVLAWEHTSMIGEDIVLTEVDIDNLMRAKGAMYAGYQTLLESVGLSFADLQQVILAGNFGAYLDLEQAICIGLLPDIDREQFYYLGNASMLGCQISMTDMNRFREREQVRQLMTNMELSENPQFMQHYMAALFLPHTDMRLFPTVGKKLADSLA